MTSGEAMQGCWKKESSRTEFKILNRDCIAITEAKFSKKSNLQGFLDKPFKVTQKSFALFEYLLNSQISSAQHILIDRISQNVLTTP